MFVKNECAMKQHGVRWKLTGVRSSPTVAKCCCFTRETISTNQAGDQTGTRQKVSHGIHGVHAGSVELEITYLYAVIVLWWWSTWDLKVVQRGRDLWWGCQRGRASLPVSHWEWREQIIRFSVWLPGSRLPVCPPDSRILHPVHLCLSVRLWAVRSRLFMSICSSTTSNKCSKKVWHTLNGKIFLT